MNTVKVLTTDHLLVPYDIFDGMCPIALFYMIIFMSCLYLMFDYVVIDLLQKRSIESIKPCRIDVKLNN